MSSGDIDGAISRTYPADRAIFTEEVEWIDAECRRNDQQLHHIDAALTPLVFGAKL